MTTQNSRCMNVHFESVVARDDFIARMVETMRELREHDPMGAFFFNRYSNPRTGECFIKMGVFNFDDDAQSRIDELFETSSIERIEPYQCETRPVGRFPIDTLKCYSTEWYEKTRDHFKEKPSLEQMGYMLHFFINQLGFGYEEEMQLYSMMIQSIKNTLHQARG